jgi:hypothetical protein
VDGRRVRGKRDGPSSGPQLNTKPQWTARFFMAIFAIQYPVPWLGGLRARDNQMVQETRRRIFGRALCRSNASFPVSLSERFAGDASFVAQIVEQKRPDPAQRSQRLPTTARLTCSFCVGQQLKGHLSRQRSRVRVSSSPPYFQSLTRNQKKIRVRLGPISHNTLHATYPLERVLGYALQHLLLNQC